MKNYGLEAFMSGRGNCYDNAPMESFWAILKQELVHHRHNHTLQEAMAEIAEYIEIFYSKPEGQSTTCLQVGECKGLGYSLFFK